MKVAIFGASGGVGRLLLDGALRRGNEVRAVYREAVTQARSAHLEIVSGSDISEPDLIRRAIDGCDVVFSSVGLRRLNPANPWSPLVSPPDLTSRFAGALLRVVEQ